jgi:hypothetical protein
MHPKRLLDRTLKVFKYKFHLLIVKKDIYSILEWHFNLWSDINHVNYSGFMTALEKLGGQPALIVETGTSAWGTDSTRLWDTYIRKFGGELHSVDIGSDASNALKGQMSRNTTFIVDDSVHFLQNWHGNHPSLYYLDSWDLDLHDPIQSAEHGMKELQMILPFLQKGTLILIDDTPCDKWFENFESPNSVYEFKNKFGVFPGKGAFYEQVLNPRFKYKVLHHEYSLLIEVQ